MSETVLLTGFCKRRGHVMYQVLDTGAVLVVDAPQYCAGRTRDTWTPKRRRLDPLNGRVSRYGCGCGRTSLVADADLWADIQKGECTRLEAAYSIGV